MLFEDLPTEQSVIVPLLLAQHISRSNIKPRMKTLESEATAALWNLVQLTARH